MTEEEIAKEYVQNNTDETVNSFIGEQLQKAFIEGTDFMYYSNNEELRRQLTEKGKQIAELKKIEEEYYDFIQKKNEEDWKGDNVVGCLKLKIEQLKDQIEKMKNMLQRWYNQHSDKTYTKTFYDKLIKATEEFLWSDVCEK